MVKEKSHAKSLIKKGRKPKDVKPDKRLTPNQRAFLKAYAASGLVGLAAEAADISRELHSRWMKSSAAYREAFEPAHERAIETMEAEARRRAVEGVQQTVFYEGIKCGTKQVYSDVLLMFLLKAARPERYAERSLVAVVPPEEIARRFPELAKPGRAAATATLSAARKAAGHGRSRTPARGRRAGKG